MPIVLSQSWEAQAILSVGAQMSATKARAWQQTAGCFVFKHKRCGYHLREIERMYARMHDVVKASIAISQAQESVFSSYAGPLLEDLYFNLDGFFEAMRSAHDASLSCLGSANLLKNPPNSLNAFRKNQERQSSHTEAARSAVRELLLDFWQSTAQSVKDYRDCLAHYISLSGPTWQHAANAKWNQGSWNLTVLLPDNPEARTYDALSFESRLDALAVCRRLHQETDAFVISVLNQTAKHWNVDPATTNTIQITAANVRIGE